jgi:hypothetical protein
MLDEPSIREKAHEAIRSGKMPTRSPDRTFGGPGGGATCSICGEQVRRYEMGLEIEFNRPGAPPGADRYHLRPRCFAMWESERTKVQG